MQPHRQSRWPLFYQALQGKLQEALSLGNQDYNQTVHLGAEAREELNWWQHHLTHWNGRTTLRTPVQILIQSDASLSGWEAVCKGVSTGGLWTLLEREMHINCLNLLAADLGMKSFLKQWQCCYNWTTPRLWHTSKIWGGGGALSPTLTALARTLWLWALERDIIITAQHIPGGANTMADCKSRDRSHWMLAFQVSTKINSILGPLEIDLFASRLG